MNKKRSILILAVVAIISMFSLGTFASDFDDMPDNWSRPALEKAVENGLLKGSEGEIRSQDHLTRAEMAAIVNRAFNAEEKAPLTKFTDVSKAKWYYNEMAKAVQMGTFVGSGNKLNPDQKISREEAFLVLARAFDISGDNIFILDKFIDRKHVSKWAEDEVAGLVSGGYIGGSNARLNPKDNITRAEMAQVMDNLVKLYISQAGDYTSDITGNVMINKAGVVLKGISISGDLIIADGIKDNEVSIEDSNITGRIVMRDFEDDSRLRVNQLVEILHNSAKKYNDLVEKEDIKRAYEKNVLEKDRSEFITKSQYYSMVFNTDFPQASGNNKRIGLFDPDFKSIKDPGIQKLSSLGLLTEDEMDGESPITKGELNRILSKIYTYSGTNIKDDFYTGVNKDWLDKEIFEEYNKFDLIDANIKLKNERIEAIILEIVESNPEEGSLHQRIKDFYKSYLNFEKREEIGIDPIREYFERIDGVSSIEELMEVEASMNNEITTQPIIRWYVYRDDKDSTRNSIFYEGLPSMTLKNQLLDEDDEFTEAYLDYLRSILGLIGGRESDAEEIYKFEKDIASHSLNNEDYWDVSKYYNPYTKTEFAKLFKGFDFEKFMEDYGLGQVDRLIAHNEGGVKRLGQLMVDENLNVFKNMAKLNLYISLSEIFIGEYAKPGDIFYETSDEVKSLEDIKLEGIDQVRAYFPDDIEKLYVDKYFPREAKEDLEKMISDIVLEYETLLNQNTWLSDQAKEKAIDKLNGITFKMGYPNKWDTSKNDITIKADNYIENALAIAKTNNDKLKASLYENPIDRNKWVFWYPPSDGKYNLDVNEVVFSSTILQGEIYDIDRSREENLGAIGVMIAREISHAFDEEGSYRDKYGRDKPWWTPEDRSKYQVLSNNAVKAFDGIEVIPGIFSDGRLTLKENMADITGLNIALAVCQKDKDADLKKFFESYAKSHKSIISREEEEYSSKTDSYSSPILRVNRVLGHIDEFYKTYEIKKADHMYMPKDLRLNIWE